MPAAGADGTADCLVDPRDSVADAMLHPGAWVGSHTDAAKFPGLARPYVPGGPNVHRAAGDWAEPRAVAYGESTSAEDKVREEVKALTAKFPIYNGLGG